MSISLSGTANSANPFNMSRRTPENNNPMANTFSRKVEVMRERTDRLRQRQQEAMMARMMEEKLQNYADEDIGLNPILAKAIVSNNMAMNRIQNAYSARADVVSRIGREGNTEELQEALIRTTAKLAAQLGEVFSNIEEAYRAVAQENAEQSDEITSNSVWDIPQYTADGGAPPSGLLINAVT